MPNYFFDVAKSRTLFPRQLGVNISIKVLRLVFVLIPRSSEFTSLFLAVNLSRTTLFLLRPNLILMQYCLVLLRLLVYL